MNSSIITEIALYMHTYVHVPHPTHGSSFPWLSPESALCWQPLRLPQTAPGRAPDSSQCSDGGWSPEEGGPGSEGGREGKRERGREGGKWKFLIN